MNGGGGQKSVVLILARELASNIATPMLVLDSRGTLIFYNEPAAVVLGEPFNQAGEIPAEVWDQRWTVADGDGKPISLLDSPLAAVVTDQTPGHADLQVTGLDGIMRAIETTVFPLFDSAQQFVGAVAVFWQTDNGHGPAGSARRQ